MFDVIKKKISIIQRKGGKMFDIITKYQSFKGKENGCMTS